MSWTNLKAAIATAIRTNNNQEITGAILQNTLNSIVNSVGANATFAGVATPSTSPGTPDGPVFWIAGQHGVYSNFGNEPFTVNKYELGIFTWDGSQWSFDGISLEIAEDAFDDLNLTDATPTYALDKAIDIALTKYNDGDYRMLAQLHLPSATNEKAGLMSVEMRNLLYNLRNVGYAFAGVATPSVNPGIPNANCFYIATDAGTYTHFTNADDEALILEQNGLYALTYDAIENNYWEYQLIKAFDEEPTAGSRNLVESGGVFDEVNAILNIFQNKYLDSTGSINNTFSKSFAVNDYFYIVIGSILYVQPAASSNNTYICFYDKNKQFIGSLTAESNNWFYYTIKQEDIPEGAVYFRANLKGDAIRYTIPINEVVDILIKNKDAAKYPVKVNSGYAVNGYGVVYQTTSADFNLTDAIIAHEGIILKNCHPGAVYGADNERVYAVFFDVQGLAVGCLTSNSGSRVTKMLAEADIPAEAIYLKANLYDNGDVFEANYADGKDIEEISKDLYYNMSVPVGKTSYNCFLIANGNIKKTSSATFKVSDFCVAKVNIAIKDAIRVSNPAAENTFLCFYDKDFKHLSNLTKTGGTTFNYTLKEGDIPSNAMYFRVTLQADTGYIDYRIPANCLLSTSNNDISYFDYKAVLRMPRQTVVQMIELASNGRCTALYDDDGYPSLMFKIPKTSIGALAPALGELTDVHPAFKVNGTEKDYLYISVFMTSNYDGHYVSWFGLYPVGQITIPDLRTNIANKGNGWHLETIYERSLLVLLTMHLNSPTPTGNTQYGMSHINNWEYCQSSNHTLPGVATPSVGKKWINGTQPAAWSHNKELWGIQDVIGGFHEICDLMKLVNGKIYMPSDNKYFKKGDDAATFEDTWADTGVAYDYINENVVLNTQVTNPMVVEHYVPKTYPEIGCTSDYDTLSLSLRQKMCLLLMTSRLSSSDSTPILPIDGRFNINNNLPLCYGVFGGATEYNKSGLGSQTTAYPIDDNSVESHSAHTNMGSRMVYIP